MCVRVWAQLESLCTLVRGMEGGEDRRGGLTLLPTGRERGGREMGVRMGRRSAGGGSGAEKCAG